LERRFSFAPKAGFQLKGYLDSEAFPVGLMARGQTVE
jgi:hypothetical protein